MNDEHACESCGRSSRDPTRCTHCGHAIEPEATASGASIQRGRLTLRFKVPSEAERVWKELAPLVWKEDSGEPWDWLKLRQLEQFKPGAIVVELYGPDTLLPRVEEILQGRGTVEFASVDPEQLPWFEPGPPKETPEWYHERVKQRHDRKGKG